MANRFLNDNFIKPNLFKSHSSKPREKRIDNELRTIRSKYGKVAKFKILEAVD